MDTSGLEITETGTYNFNGLTIEVMHDPEPESPREWSTLGTMLCTHGRYMLGDKNAKETLREDIRNCKAYRDSWEKKYNMDDIMVLTALASKCGFIMLPLYLYDHSGITMNTTGFSCPWDSGQVGVILVSREWVRAEYDTSRVTAKLKAKVLDALKAEVATYDEYLRGDVYGWSVEDAGVAFDSCWGYYGFDYMVTEIKERLASMDVV